MVRVSQASEQVAKQYSSAANVKKIWGNILVNVLEHGVKGDGKTDDGPAIQTVLNMVRDKGGGVLFFPAGDYLINTTIYTTPVGIKPGTFYHPIELLGNIPVSFTNSSSPGITRFKRTVPGTMIGANYNETTDCYYLGVINSFTIRNISFLGSGTPDPKYFSTYEEYASTLAINAIELHRTRIEITDCCFDRFAWGIYQPDELIGFTDGNYCDQCVYQRLEFQNMGIGWIRIVHGDSSKLDRISGYRMCPTAQYGVYITVTNSLEIGTVLCASKQMLRNAANFHVINVGFSESIMINAVYSEFIVTPLIRVRSSSNVSIGAIYARHYAGTLVQGVDAKNVHVEEVSWWVEEGKRLNVASDPGDYSVYESYTQPPTYDIDNACYGWKYKKSTFQNGVHSGGSFTKTTLRSYPVLPATDTKDIQGEPITSEWIYHSGLTSVIPTFRGFGLSMSTMFDASSYPVYNGTTGNLTFPNEGLFKSLGGVMLSPAKAATTSDIILPVVIQVSPLIVRIYVNDYATLLPQVDIAKMRFEMTLYPAGS